MKSPIGVLLAVLSVGGSLRIDENGVLKAILPLNCPLKESIRHHKARLIELLNLVFLIVQSDAVNAPLFWTPDAATKQVLIEAGADPGICYTVAELGQLVRCQVTIEELMLIQTAKQHFSGRIEVFILATMSLSQKPRKTIRNHRFQRHAGPGCRPPCASTRSPGISSKL
jgi:hypothetical protein